MMGFECALFGLSAFQSQNRANPHVMNIVDDNDDDERDSARSSGVPSLTIFGVGR
jgi:hypothetical protein